MRRKNKDQLAFDFTPKSAFGLAPSPKEITLCQVCRLPVFETTTHPDGIDRMVRVGQHTRCWRGEQP